MNVRLVLKVLGRVLLIEAGALALPMLVAVYYQESILPFLISIAVACIVGGVLCAITAERKFFVRDGFISVGFIWIVTCLLGALPFAFCGYFPSFVDCLFESCSGFTTTGATILADIEALPRSILFWRAFTHWLGGMGVLVLASAVLPSMGVRAQYLMQAEITGPVFSKLVPKQAKSSKILYRMYCVLTAIEIICLRVVGMPLFDAVVHAFSSAGTGGFSSKNASIGAYHSLAIEMVITVFLLLFSLNFAVHFLLLTRRWREVVQSDELRFFLGLVAFSSVLIACNSLPLYKGIFQSLRYGIFQVVSTISTTGFSTYDYTLWPQFSQMILLLLMFCGASAGSTGGGMKCARVLIALRTLRREIHQILHPRSVELVTLDGKVVEESIVRGVLTFCSGYLFIILISALLLSLDNFSFSVTFSAALASLSNVGPALDFIGPSGNFAVFSAFSKLVMSACMIIGRLELFPILVLLSRAAWRRA